MFCGNILLLNHYYYFSNYKDIGYIFKNLPSVLVSTFSVTYIIPFLVSFVILLLTMYVTLLSNFSLNCVQQHPFLLNFKHTIMVNVLMTLWCISSGSILFIYHVFSLANTCIFHAKSHSILVTFFYYSAVISSIIILSFIILVLLLYTSFILYIALESLWEDMTCTKLRLVYYIIIIVAFVITLILTVITHGPHSDIKVTTEKSLCTLENQYTLAYYSFRRKPPMCVEKISVDTEISVISADWQLQAIEKPMQVSKSKQALTCDNIRELSEYLTLRQHNMTKRKIIDTTDSSFQHHKDSIMLESQEDSVEQTGMKELEPNIIPTSTTPSAPQAHCTKVDKNSAHTVALPLLYNIHYLDEHGNKYDVRITDEVASHWKDLAMTFGFDVHYIALNHNAGSNYVKNCLYDVLKIWMERGGSPQYTMSWNGLIKALKNIQLYSIADRLETALDCVLY